MKSVLFILFLLLTSCHRSPWQHTSIRSGNHRYDMAQLTYPSSSETNGVELEITRVGKEIDAYINVHCFELPKLSDDSHTTMLTIDASGATRTFVLPLLEGGQRAHLTETCLNYLLQILILKDSVILSSGHFSTVIDASHFERHYDALLKKPSVLQPRSMIRWDL